MTKAEEKAVENMLLGVYGLFHGCRLPMRLVKEESKSNRRTVCDDCKSFVKAYLEDLKKVEK